ncbi:MAG: precorrin-6y C5,15-methyltransferase (decarboxylating) subunit CbiE [Actinobacteria bacterium]|nr:precorrin-6y C5,15-methyltransferase (decarboxylating) subunit CbiE [Actinomycetota bacterium]
MVERGRLLVVGVGPAEREYLTPAAARLARSCEAFVGGAAALRAAPAWGERVEISGPLDSVLDRVGLLLEQGKRVCVLTSGDPGYFGMLAALERRFPGEAVVEPGVSSTQLLAARLGLAWQELTHTSVHGRALEAPDFTDRPIAVLCGGDNTPEAVASLLLDVGWQAQAAVGVGLGGPHESVTVGDLPAIAAGAFGSPAVMIVAPDAWLREGNRPFAARRDDPAAGSAPSGAVAPGIADEEFERLEQVPLSRWEVRSVLASVARPASRRVIWDVGAGSGGFSVELALLSPDARVIAFERGSAGCEAIRRNAQHFGARVEVVEGTAPDALPCSGDETRPDLVVIGGSGGRLEEILTAVAGCIKPGGRVIVTAVTLETAGNAASLLSWEPWMGLDAVQLATAHLEKAGIMRGANPVTIVWADKEDRP